MGGGTVNVYDPTSGALLGSMTDNSGTTYNAGSTFDSSGNLYVTDDDAGQISEFNSSGTQIASLTAGLSDASGDSNDPLSLVFDNAGNLYVGQQSTPYIAEYNSSGVLQAPIGPLETQLYGDDWIDLAPDEQTFYYTTEGDEILTYNDQTKAQGVFNKVQFPSTQTVMVNGVPKILANQAFELKILANGDVLVADSSEDILLNADGSVNQVYSCSSMPGCGDQLFAISVDPSGTSFWTADSSTGNIYQINIATGAVMQTIATGSGTLYGLSVDDQLEVATPSTTPTGPPPEPATLSAPTITGTFVTGQPTPVSARTDSSGNPIVGEPVTFTLNGTETCAQPTVTNALGVATCDITPGESSGTYTLTDSFGGDTGTTPIEASASSGTFTVNPVTTTVTYTGPGSTPGSTLVNGQPITLTATVSTPPTAANPTGAIPPGLPVTFTIGSGSTAQTYTCATDASGDGTVTCPSPIVVDQPTTAVTLTTSFGGGPYDMTASTTTLLTVTEPTTLTVEPGSSDYSDQTTVTGVLKDANTGNPIAGEPLTLSLNNNPAETCTTGLTDSTGTASCQITPVELAGPYTLYGNFAGDAAPPASPLLQLTGSSGSAPFTVTLEETELGFNGTPYTAFNSGNLTVSATLTSDEGATPVVGRTLTFTLGSGPTAQTCTPAPAPTNSSGTVSCTIDNVNQVVGPVPLTVAFASDGYYQPANAATTVTVGPEQTGTTLTVASATSDYNDATTVTATLIDQYTGAGAANEPVTFMLGATQPCGPVMTNASGVASCQITPNEAAGSYTLTATFGGDTSVLPHLDATTGTNTFVVTHEEASLTYSGVTTAVFGSSAVLSGTLSTDGNPLAGRLVTFTLGSGASAQVCGGTTNSAGFATCTISNVKQTTSPVPVKDSFAGDAYYVPANSSGSVVINTPTTLTVSAGTGTYGQSTTLSGTLTNSVTGAPVSGQTVTLTLNGTQPCTAVTNAQGQASCSVTPNEPGGGYTVTGSFAGSTGTTVLLPTSGHNCFQVNKATTTLTSSSPSQVFEGGTDTLSSTLTSNGTPIAGQPVVLTLGTGRSTQTCTGTTNAAGVASCTVTVNQVEGSVTVTASYGGNTYYQSSSTSSSVQIGCGGGGGGSGGGGSGGGGSGGGCGTTGGGGQGGGCKPPVGGGEGCG